MMRAMKQAPVILDRLGRREATPLGHQLENRPLGPFRILSVTQRIPVAGLFVVVTLTSEHFGLVGFALLSIRFFGGDHSSFHILRRRSVFCISTIKRRGSVLVAAISRVTRFAAKATRLEAVWSVSQSTLRLRNVPSTIEEAVACDVARFLVVFPGIERAAFVSPLLAAIVARDDCVVAHRHRAGRRC